MSKLNDLTAITTPSLSDLVYCVQNSTDYKITNQQLLDLIKTNTVIPLTQAQYDALTPAEKNNGSIYVIKDASITAADVEYSSGVSVKDKLDSIPIIASGIAKFPAQATGTQTVEIDISSYGFTAKPIAVCCPNDSAVFYNYMKDIQVLDTSTTATKLVLQGNRINASSQWNVAWIAIGV